MRALLLLLLFPCVAGCAFIDVNPKGGLDIDIGGTTTYSDSERMYVWDGYVDVTIPTPQNLPRVEAIWSIGLMHADQRHPRKLELDSTLAQVVDRTEVRTVYRIPLKLMSRSAPRDEWAQAKLEVEPFDLYDIERVHFRRR